MIKSRADLQDSIKAMTEVVNRFSPTTDTRMTEFQKEVRSRLEALQNLDNAINSHTRVSSQLSQAVKVIQTDLFEKTQLRNAIEVVRKLGYEVPFVAVTSELSGTPADFSNEKLAYQLHLLLCELRTKDGTVDDAGKTLLSQAVLIEAISRLNGGLVALTGNPGAVAHKLMPVKPVGAAVTQVPHP